MARRIVNPNEKEKVMFAKLVYRGLPAPVLMTVTAFVQYLAIYAFA